MSATALHEFSPSSENSDELEEEDENFMIFSLTDLDASPTFNGADNINNIQNTNSVKKILNVEKCKPKITLRQKRRSILQGSSIFSFDRRHTRHDSGVDVISSQQSPPKIEDNTPIAKWKRAFRKIHSMQDPWKKFHLHSYPAERALRHRYNALTKKWHVDEVVVKMEAKEFNSGAMRSCYRLKKLPRVKDEKHLSFLEVMQRMAADQGLRWTSQARNCVAKKYMEDVERKVYFEDVQLQMDAKLWGEEYNRHHPPKQVDIIEMSVLEFVDRDEKPLYHLENFIDGEYIKYNSNSGFVEENVRMTPQAFSHFTFERSAHTAIVVDIQGVGDLWTDPQMHTFDGIKYGEGNLGIRGMALFFHSHHCNAICASLGLGVFDLYNGQKEFDGLNFKRLVWESENQCENGDVDAYNTNTLSSNVNTETPETRVRGIEDHIEIGSPSWMSLPIPEIKDEELNEEENEDEGIASPGSSEKTSRGRFLSGSDCSSANTLTEEEERLNFQRAVKRGARPSCVLIEMGKVARNALKGNSILGLIHHEMAKYHEMGRFVNKGHCIDYKASVYHEQQASNLGIYEASLTLAEIFLNKPHDILSSISLVDTDTTKGWEYMNRAAEQGERRAMLILADSLYAGDGLDKNYKEAIAWYEKAMTVTENEEERHSGASIDHPTYEIQSRIADMCLQGGFGLMAKEPRKAGDLYTEAAEAAMECMKGKLATKLYAMAEEAYALCEDDLEATE